MSCREYSEAIAEFVDGALDPVRQRALERHVEGCEACRALVADLRSIQAAAFTLDRVELPPRLWDAVQARVASEPAPGSRGRVLAWPETRAAWRVWLAAAAVLMLATAAGTYQLLRTPDLHRDDEIAATPAPVAPNSVDAVNTVQMELQAAEEHYNKAIQGLEQIARSESGALDPQVAAVLQKNLQAIDQAIVESREALQTDSFFDAMRSKVALLQQTVELINEMRKGNQAEAGRLIQGMNQ